MLTMTESAGAHLSQMLTAVEAPENTAVRIIVEGEGLGLTLDNERSGDSTFEHEGKTVLLLDDPMSNLLTDKTLDVEDKGEGPKLALR
ncbi:MAG: hypothetical protein ACE5IM_14085 [Nitrospinota bacterium]